eukprot:scaffold866_cov544-Prasinococcus_capsulatus_cf.AAC.7
MYRLSGGCVAPPCGESAGASDAPRRGASQDRWLLDKQGAEQVVLAAEQRLACRPLVGGAQRSGSLRPPFRRARSSQRWTRVRSADRHRSGRRALTTVPWRGAAREGAGLREGATSRAPRVLATSQRVRLDESSLSAPTPPPAGCYDPRPPVKAR